MLTVLDIIHLIQYYYQTTSYDSATSEVEHFKLESLRGMLGLRIKTLFMTS
jgi:5'-AMP-activated protein kinase regulatory gamma subunit